MAPKKRATSTAKASTRASTKRRRDDSNYESTSTAGKLSNTKNQFSLARATELFNKYKDQTDDCIGPDGMIELCNDLDVMPENINMLILAWQLNAQQMGYFTRQEWTMGMQKLNADSISKIKALQLERLIEDPSDFKEMFRFAFEFARDPEQKSLSLDTAIQMFKLLLEPKWTGLSSFISFLEQSHFKVVNRDQWMNVFEFSLTINPDLSNYDQDGA
eukprot:Ihof_evm13s45 gene=Ihof_evmTU13s45